MLNQEYGKRNEKSMKTWIQLVRAYNKIYSKEKKYVEGFGITFGQFVVLEVLYHKGVLSVSDVTFMVASTPGNITVVVKNLLKEQLIESEKKKDDKRVILLKITEKGSAVIEKMFQGHAVNFGVWFEELSDFEMESLYHILKKLQKSQGKF